MRVLPTFSPSQAIEMKLGREDWAERGRTEVGLERKSEGES